MTTLKSSSYRWLFWCLALLGVAGDLSSKYLVFRALYNDGRGSHHELIKGTFALTAQFTGEHDTSTGLLHELRAPNGAVMPYVNQGALFGMGGDGDHAGHANLFFLCVSFAAALAIMFWSTRASFAGDWWLCMATGLILGGTLGNLYDRIVFNGVRDFLHWYYGVNWPVFNFADCCLVCGAVLLLIQAVFMPLPVEETAAQPLAANGAQTVAD